MSKRKPKSDYDCYEPEPNDLVLGSYGGYQQRPRGDKKVKPQIGFVRQKVEATVTRKRK